VQEGLPDETGQATNEISLSSLQDFDMSEPSFLQIPYEDLRSQSFCFTNEPTPQTNLQLDVMSVSAFNLRGSGVISSFASSTSEYDVGLEPEAYHIPSSLIESARCHQRMTEAGSMRQDREQAEVATTRALRCLLS
jgi:hypothetical protein